MKRLDSPEVGAFRLAILTIAALAMEQEETSGGGTEDAAGEVRQQAENENFARGRRLGNGGEVEVRFEEGRLDLLDARPNDGWNVEADERSGDEIEVDFSRAEETWRFDAKLNDGNLKVRIWQELRDAEAGTNRLGNAGAVEVRHEGEGITLVHTRTIGGWSERVEQEDDEVKVRPERHDDRWTFEAKVDDCRLEVHNVRRVNEPVRI